MKVEKEEVKVEEKPEAVCMWKNRGLKSQPYWYIAECNNSVVNVKKAMIKKGNFIDCCPFCGSVIQWLKADKKK